MSPEVIAILAVGVALAGIGINAQRTARADIQSLRTEFNRKFDDVQAEFNGLRDEMGNLRERMAKLEGLLEGLREAIAGRRDAA